MKQLNLQDTPRPHYVRSGEFKKRDNGFRFDGEVIFPSDDPTIADRGHVNVLHLFAVISNVGHLAAREQLLLSGMRILSQSGNYYEESPTGLPIDISVEATYLKWNESRMKGDALVTFEYGGKILSRTHIVFLAN